VHKGRVTVVGILNRLLDVEAVAFIVSTNPAFAAGIAPAAVSVLDTDGLLHNWQKRCTDRFITVDADEMTTQVVFSAEGTTT